jgi:hypothetical protein
MRAFFRSFAGRIAMLLHRTIRFVLVMLMLLYGGLAIAL